MGTATLKAWTSSPAREIFWKPNMALLEAMKSIGYSQDITMAGL